MAKKKVQLGTLNPGDTYTYASGGEVRTVVRQNPTLIAETHRDRVISFGRTEIGWDYKDTLGVIEVPDPKVVDLPAGTRFTYTGIGVNYRKLASNQILRESDWTVCGISPNDSSTCEVLS